MTFDKFINKTKLLGVMFEQFLYRTADKFSTNYKGGYWKSKNIEGFENFFYVELDDDVMYEIRNDQNHYDKGAMDSKTFSLAIFAYALNTFGYHLYSQGKIEASKDFFDLYNFVMANALNILGDEEKHSQFYWFLD